MPQIIVNIFAIAAIVCGMPMCYFILAQGTKTQNTIEIGGIILMLGYFISLAAGIISYFLKDRDIAVSTTG